ncbi:UNVERIFIED_CONTAM: hypothetical protein Sradi_6940400 [Sesamum radiatum]|uniref:Polyprotein n=1 Tax=Sesamum radiatum TaxID=300843 RepID=A0AAW2JFE6_SESRA
MFHEQLGRNMEVYIDDMLVKNRQMYQHLADLAEAFGTLRKFHMKLRPAKCAFGWSWGNTHQPTRGRVTICPTFCFKASNNETEYEALIASIIIALDAGARNLISYYDSQSEGRMYCRKIHESFCGLHVEGMVCLVLLFLTMIVNFKAENFKIGVLASIQQRFTFVAYPQTNGQVEVINRILVQGIKIKLMQADGQWVDTLPGCCSHTELLFVPLLQKLISIWCMEHSSHPLEAQSETFRIQCYEQENNNNLLRTNLDLIEVVREDARTHLERYKQRIVNAYNRRVRIREFQVETLCSSEETLSDQ